ncbi:MAG: acetyl-CoA carboxylase biotin carboxyl carrier protein [Chitinophagaceae bacterium]
MDFKQIQELIRLVNDSNIGEVSLEQKDFKLTIKQKEEQITHVVSAPQSAPLYQSFPPPLQQQGLPQATGSTTANQPDITPTTVTIKSPMIGTFYRRSAPDKPDFVAPGDEVSPGKVVCIIEAMKLFNEIESEIKGRIVKVLVEDASPVEFDQPLFLVDPS